MKVLFIGRTEWLYNSILEISKIGKHEILGIITSKASFDYKVDESDFSILAKNLGTRFLFSNKLTKKEITDVFGNDIDLGISVNYVNIIDEEVIAMFKYGILNAHGGDLPQYRGNACSAWAIINGERKVGLCIHKMIGGELDSGNIIVRDYYKIQTNTYIADIYKWFEAVIPELFINALNLIEKDPNYFLERQSQKKQNILRCYPRTPEDGKIDWSKSAEEIHRLVRASSEPYRGAFSFEGNDKIIIWRTKLVDDSYNWIGVPGQFAEFDNQGFLNILTGQGKIKLIQIERNGIKDVPCNIYKSVRKRFK